MSGTRLRMPHLVRPSGRPSGEGTGAVHNGRMLTPVDLRSYVSARDRRLLSEILAASQLLTALGGYARSDFLGSEPDQRTARERLRSIAKAARDVSERTKRTHGEVPWEALARGAPDEPIPLWNVVKKTVPRAVLGIRPLVGREEPAAAFLLEIPEQPRRKKGTVERLKPRAERKKG